MKIRTQLILAFLLLAVVPLAGIVLYSYYSSLRAVRRATETEARTLTREMNGRLAAIKSELGRGVDRMRDVPLQAVMRAAKEGKPDPDLDRMVLGFGDAAPLLDSLEFVPAPHPPAWQVPQSAAPPPAPVPPVPPVPPAVGPGELPHNPMVIDVAAVLRDVRKELAATPGQDPRAAAAIGEALKEIESPGTEAARAVPSAPDAERLKAEIEKQVGDHLAAHAAEHRQKAEMLRHAMEQRKAQEAAMRLAFGRDFEVPVVEHGEVVGKLKAQVKSDEVLRRILARTGGGEGEIAFAVDGQGGLHTANDADRKRLEGLPPLLRAVHASAGSARWILDDWVVASSKDPDTGLVFGIARPVPLEEVRQTAARNFGYGLGLTALALFGILPLSTGMTRNLRVVTEGADRIAQGDLETRVPVRSKNEFGRLALAFNRMAADLKQHQQQLLEEERLRKEREIAQALLQTEYDRKSRDLEEARRFQLSLLPRTLPEHPGFEIAVSMRTATEVGGDYYDFFLADDGALTVAIGDATGHGARAGTMVTAVKSLFSADAGASGPRQFLAEAARAVKRMGLERMAMALALARLEGRQLVVSSAGMPPLLIYRRQGARVEEVALAGMPLGGLAFDYEERRLEIAPGDTILLMTDGLPELADPEGEPLGYPRVRSLFGELGGLPQAGPEDVIAGLTRAAESWAAGQPYRDDVTLVAIRVR
ncbi:MAG TPA: SpoIIE family protein phosphatase [Thermoanaerobaculia bacterium]|jgi:serine phosphatase RsbU (regulator of sigma subunit)|nr:SpoIIE family protein phosphatase [Thermoanaerobaculia bacterium]